MNTRKLRANTGSIHNLELESMEPNPRPSKYTPLGKAVLGIAAATVLSVAAYGLNWALNAPQRMLEGWYQKPCQILSDKSDRNDQLRIVDLGLLIQNISHYRIDERDSGFEITERERGVALRNASAHRDYLETNWPSHTGRKPLTLKCCDAYAAKRKQ